MTRVLNPPAPTVPVKQNGESNGNSMARAAKQTALASMAERFAIEPTRLMEVLKGTVIKGSGGRQASNEEVAAFIVVANQYGLNPFTREIHAFADSQRGVVPIVGIDGWSHIVNNEPRFDGCEFEETEGQDGKPVSTTCAMYVKDRSRPVKITERFSECRRQTGPWNQMPYRMLRHKAFMQAARLAFSISGLYDEDEARDIIQGADTVPAQPPVSRTASVLAKVTQQQAAPTTGDVVEAQQQTVEPVGNDTDESHLLTRGEYEHMESLMGGTPALAAADAASPTPEDTFAKECWALSGQSGHSDPDLYERQFHAAVDQATDGGKKRLGVSAKSRITHEIKTRTGAFAPPAAPH